jgi:Protein of unknown function (DUF1592)/Protein of unknown function (DUF1588)/Protein of unknown function (DUF1585)/Protein of unknown function (DUF1595)/Protein of unknown function (DUF1587)
MIRLLIAFITASTAHTVAAGDYDSAIKPLLQEYCLKCHGAGDQVEGDVNLSLLQSDTLTTDIALVRKLIDVLDLQEMPPADEPQPDPARRLQGLRALRTILHAAVPRDKTFLQAPIRRMNRFQYNNSVIDLFDLNCIVFTLPERMMREHKGYFKPESGKMADVVTVGSRPLGKSQMIERRLAGVAAFPQDLRAEHGFDNRGDHLSLSPLLMESFLNLGQSITRSPDFVPRNVGIWSSFFAAPVARSDTESEVRRRLEPFLARAFRRPIELPLLNRYVAFVSGQLDSGVAFSDAMKSVAAATISSPKFLYLYETSAHAATAEDVDDYELASRLSFFLWGSLPDQTLLALAADGTLSRPEILDAQIDRLLRDHKLKRFCDSFPTQWLQLEKLISSEPDRELFPDFYFSKYRDSMHMMMEPLLLFETVLIENQPITQLIDSDFTYRSDLLEDAYRRPDDGATVKPNGGSVTVLKFHRMPVTDRRHGGVITNAAIMTMTSGPDRTQPVTRGAWIAGVIFNDPPKPPPANVPPLSKKPDETELKLTLRERLAIHRQRSDCKGCHEQIDPLGFALENYNPIGVWRDDYVNGRDVDASGLLFRKHAFENVVEFKDAILAEKRRFIRGFAGQLLSFALARELGPNDQTALDKIVTATLADSDRFQTLLKQVILSEPFRSKTIPPVNRG